MMKIVIVSLRLKEVYPEFADELRGLLSDEPDLASSVEELQLIDRCRCEDNFCSSFYTAPPPNGAWGAGHENIVLDSASGMIILDVVDRKITMVEVLDRNDVRKKIQQLIP